MRCIIVGGSDYSKYIYSFGDNITFAPSHICNILLVSVIAQQTVPSGIGYTLTLFASPIWGDPTIRIVGGLGERLRIIQRRLQTCCIKTMRLHCMIVFGLQKNLNSWCSDWRGLSTGNRDLCGIAFIASTPWQSLSSLWQSVSLSGNHYHPCFPHSQLIIAQKTDSASLSGRRKGREAVGSIRQIIMHCAAGCVFQRISAFCAFCAFLLFVHFVYFVLFCLLFR